MMKSFQQFINEDYKIKNINLWELPIQEYLQTHSSKNPAIKQLASLGSKVNPNEFYQMAIDLLNTSNYHTKLGNNKEAQDYYKKYQYYKEVLDILNDIEDYLLDNPYVYDFHDKILDNFLKCHTSRNIFPRKFGKPGEEIIDYNFVKKMSGNDVAKKIAKNINWTLGPLSIDYYDAEHIRMYYWMYDMLSKDWFYKKYSQRLYNIILKAQKDYKQIVDWMDRNL